MKIMISDKPKWCALMMNGKKKIELRTSKVLASAIQKLIDEYGYADIYVCCSKDKKDFLVNADLIRPPFPHPRKYMLGHKDYSLNGKVLFKFRCYKVEDIQEYIDCFGTKRVHLLDNVLRASSLTEDEFNEYSRCNLIKTYAIHISDLEIFDKPKELSEFRYAVCPKTNCEYCKYNKTVDGDLYCTRRSLTKAPRNFYYVEVNENE